MPTTNSNTSRRKFLKSSAAAGLCAATAPIILPRLHAQNSANDRLAVACIGVGGRGSGIGGQAADQGQLVACCDVSGPNAEKFAKQQKEKGRDCKIYSDYRELLEKEKDVRNGKQPVANVKDHVRAVNACHLANIALLTGREVKFDPNTQQFPGDTEANRLVARPNREGYAVDG